jgi:glycosyltransferase involved in cell wall biosynthesis
VSFRVMHVFAPGYKTNFGGTTIRWKYNFSKWDDPDTKHYVLDTEKGDIIAARDAFNFEYPEVQKDISRWKRGLWFFSLFWNLIKHKGKYDLLHVHVLWWASLLIGPWAKWNKVPVLYESVLLDSDTPGGIIQQRWGKLQVRFLKYYRAIIGISEYIAEDYRRFGFLGNRVFILKNCVDDQLFSPVESSKEKNSLREDLNIPVNATVLLFVGSVIKRKGADILIRAFIAASSKQPNLYLLVVGPREKSEQPSLDEKFVSNLRLLLSEMNLANRVRFMGLVEDRQKLSKIYRASDIFVFPSTKEGLPNVVLESMASGVPVLVSNLPVLEEIIKHGKNGLFVPIGDALALRDSIIMLSGDLSLARSLVRSARQYVEEKHSFCAWQARLVEIYRSVLALS